MSKTIVTGCSWTDRNYRSRFHPELDTSWKKWDEYVADEYKWNIVNVGQSGAPNDYMLDRAIESFYEHNVERCVVALSEWGRIMLPNGLGANPSIFLRNSVHPLKINQKKALDFFKVYPFDLHFQKQRINDNLYKLYRFIDICVEKDIEVIMFQMLHSIELFKELGTIKEWIELNNVMMDNKYFNKIEDLLETNNKVKVLGWPFVHDLGGLCVNHVFDNHKDSKQWIISDDDGHPNEKGHEVIAKLFIEWYNDGTPN